MTAPTVAAMRWASAQSDLPDAALAAEDVARSLREQLGEGPVDLVLAFYSAPLAPRADAIANALRARLAPVCMAGVSARGVVTREHEIEQGVALSVIAARLPGVTISPIVVLDEVWREPPADDAAFDAIAPGMRGAELVLLAGDPYSLDIERILGTCQRHSPGLRIVGGLASAGVRPQSNTLFLNDWTTHEGGFAIALHGALRADVIVSQGCAPIGPPLDVTHVEHHVILTLDGLPALERIEQVLRELPEEDRERLRQGLYIGRPARGEATGRGDYLIRNLLGADRERGAIAVADTVGLREKIRLHVRDARAAIEDLEMLLSPQAFDTRAFGALLFACNGRGRMLFGEPDRDIVTLQETLRETLQAALGSPVPVAGMFCAGEIGPVGEKNFLHGHTASIAIIRPRTGP